MGNGSAFRGEVFENVKGNYHTVMPIFSKNSLSALTTKSIHGHKVTTVIANHLSIENFNLIEKGIWLWQTDSIAWTK